MNKKNIKRFNKDEEHGVITKERKDLNQNSGIKKIVFYQ